MKTRSLYVPSNVSLRNEIWHGLSVRDAVISLLAALAAAAVATVIAKAFAVNILWCVLGTLLCGVSSIGILSKMPEINRSMLDQLHIILSFTKSQKQYRYVYQREVEE